MKKKYIFVLISLLVLLLAACTGNNTNDQNKPNDMESGTGNDVVDNNPNGSDSENKQNEESDSNTQGSMTPAEVYDRYLEEYPDTKVRKIKLDENRGTFIYEIKGFDDDSEYEFKIDSANQEILESKSKKNSHKQTEIPKNLLNDVEKLVDEAMKDVGDGAFLDEWEVDHEDGKFILEVEIDRKNGEDISYKYDLETQELMGIDS